MYERFKDGDTVKVWPIPGLRVQAHANTPGRFLDPDGEDVTWSEWHYGLAINGAIVFTDPTKNYQRARHARHPHEWVAEHGKPVMHLTDAELAQLHHRKPFEKLTKDEHDELDRAVAWHLVPEAKEQRDAHLAKRAKAEVDASKAAAAELPPLPFADVKKKEGI